jgi:hypothetical protein
MQIDVPQGMMPMVKVWKSCRGNDAVIDRVFWEHEWRGVEWRRKLEIRSFDVSPKKIWRGVR